MSTLRVEQGRWEEEAMRVAQLMSRRVRTVEHTDRIGDALNVMLWAGVHHLVVLDDQAVAGVISERDIFVHQRSAGQAGLNDPVHSIMLAPVVIARPDDTVSDAATKMAGQRTDCLPVVGARDALVGVITVTDMLALHRQRRPKPSVANLGQLRVDAVMTPNPVAVGTDERLVAAARLMRRRGIRHLPVIDDERRPIGMLSDRDVRSVIGEWLNVESTDDPVEELTVGLVMSAYLITIPADATLHEALGAMIDERVGALPVVSGHDKLVGILSYIDLLDLVLGGPHQHAPGAQLHHQTGSL